MQTYTKQSLIRALKAIRGQGWIKSAHPGNDGAVGNTLEGLLGIAESNLPIPNAAEWELKAQKAKSTSLTTLFHMEPSPTACKIVSTLFLPNFGWKHQKAGLGYPDNEKSFRQTISSRTFSDRGFTVFVNRKARRIEIIFDEKKIDARHQSWKVSVRQRIGLEPLNPQPYWGFDDVFYKLGTKLHNCFYVIAEKKREEGTDFFHYREIFMLQDLSQVKFINAIEKGLIYVDFDARTGHNHGTKFRIVATKIPELYKKCQIV